MATRLDALGELGNGILRLVGRLPTTMIVLGSPNPVLKYYQGTAETLAKLHRMQCPTQNEHEHNHQHGHCSLPVAGPWPTLRCVAANS